MEPSLIERELVYIAHPLGGGLGREANRYNAARWCRWAAIAGYSPVADWIVLSWTLDENHRELSLACDFALISRCHMLWLVGGRISPGMGMERDCALAHGIEVYDFTSLGYVPPDESNVLPRIPGRDRIFHDAFHRFPWETFVIFDPVRVLP